MNKCHGACESQRITLRSWFSPCSVGLGDLTQVFSFVQHTLYLLSHLGPKDNFWIFILNFNHLPIQCMYMREYMCHTENMEVTGQFTEVSSLLSYRFWSSNWSTDLAASTFTYGIILPAWHFHTSLEWVFIYFFEKVSFGSSWATEAGSEACATISD